MLLAVLEVFLTLRWLLGDSSPTLAQAIVFEALNRVMTVAFKFVPFRIGVDEALSGAMAPMLALNPAAGVSLAVVRKVRSLFWSAIGLADHCRAPEHGHGPRRFARAAAWKRTSDGSPRNLVCASVLSAVVYAGSPIAHPQSRGGVVAFRCRGRDDERVERLLDGVRAGGCVIEHHETRIGAESGGKRVKLLSKGLLRVGGADPVSRGYHPVPLHTLEHPFVLVEHACRGFE